MPFKNYARIVSCVLLGLAGRASSRLSRLLSHRSMFCASHRTVVMAVAKLWQKLDLSVPRLKENNRKKTPVKR